MVSFNGIHFSRLTLLDSPILYMVTTLISPSPFPVSQSMHRAYFLRNFILQIIGSYLFTLTNIRNDPYPARISRRDPTKRLVEKIDARSQSCKVLHTCSGTKLSLMWPTHTSTYTNLNIRAQKPRLIMLKVWIKFGIFRKFCTFQSLLTTTSWWHDMVDLNALVQLPRV